MAAIDDLKTLLLQDISQLETLAEILGREKSCLANSDLRQLEILTKEKNDLLDAVRERAKQKIRTLVQMGYRPESGEPSRFIRAAGFSELFGLWQEAEQNLRTCQTLNQTNGRVISHLQKRLSTLTDIFRGATGHQKLYGAKGQQTTVSGSTVLASA
ncbi:flagella synthesis protein FlgN [Marinobacter sp. F3R08]|uniref:flagella synthesis protein FlgN n=1 Tax=Marinobacter sp. F3R08 TaxID=2841559 RepID=UPI001C08B298|nr:flagellar protein FlgN [Marinobacter sp. F3R08]MBU2952513.1 flagellar protein FlgN [Marinobacter sp. F3R08]